METLNISHQSPRGALLTPETRATALKIDCTDHDQATSWILLVRRPSTS